MVTLKHSVEQVSICRRVEVSLCLTMILGSLFLAAPAQCAYSIFAGREDQSTITFKLRPRASDQQPDLPTIHAVAEQGNRPKPA
jgi:hypothetical protein